MNTTRSFLFFAFLSFAICCKAEDTIRVACVGNSITYGSAVEFRDSLNYPMQLQRLLGDAYEVRNFGHSGATLLKKGNKPYWNLPEYQAAIDFQPNVVIIKLGTNDSKPYNWEHKAEYKVDYAALIAAFRELGTVSEVYVCLPIPVVENRWDIRKDVVEGEMQQLVREVAQENGAVLIDLHTPFLDKFELIPDKIHPNAAGAGVIARVIFEELQEYKDIRKN